MARWVRRGRLVGPVALAWACAVVVAVAPGPARFAAGLLLALVLPGWLAIAALYGRHRPDPVLAATLVGPLSFVLTAAAGLTVAGFGWGFRPDVVGTLLAVGCVVMCAIAMLRRRHARTGPAVGAATPQPTRGGVPGVARVWWAAVPVLGLTVLLLTQVVTATRHRTADSYYTEFGLDASGAVVVHSAESTPTRFRLETYVDGALRRSAGFELRPGERRVFPTVEGGTRVEIRLYRADHPEPYRRLIR
ncbi:DUF1616 domain-containing protein [Virgisporangium ochraceum]|uniref:DUF1616 domain-containing protein n=1 Tax=Virgisporangium ochraceum TaxID=65505 RepID=UPI001940F61B|nr:DUF1616 domain-containing protein [Virgisporangium ochraceum]